MYQMTHNLIPKSLANMFTKNNTIHSHSTRQATQLHIPFTRTNLAQKTIKFSGPKLWNSLADSIVKLKTLKSFKIAFKQSILKNYI